jgi:hypothetical protein
MSIFPLQIPKRENPIENQSFDKHKSSSTAEMVKSGGFEVADSFC